MKRRLYLVFDNADHTRSAVNQLLVKRVELRNLHVVTNERQSVEGLPEASIFQKNDIRHSLIIGALIGALMGLGAAIAFHYALYMPYGPIAALITLIGAVFGAWAASMIGMTTPNVDLKPYQAAIDSGKYLLIADVQKERVDEISELMHRLHPEATQSGVEPIKPSFP